MNKLFLECDYLEIVLALLKSPYQINSIIKLVFISFCIKHEPKTSYQNRKLDFVDVLLKNLNIKLFSHPDDLICIFEIICKLKKCGWIRTEHGKIFVLKNISEFRCDNAFLNWCSKKKNNPIFEINKLDDKAFLEEVLRHV